MDNTIKIIEENNQLRFDGEYEPIVCGNSIYSISFQFTEKWAACENKTAVFVVDGRYVLISFTGNVVNVPVLPNASCLSVSLLSGNGEDQLATTALKINLKTTPSINNYVNLDLFENYLQKIHSAVNKIENGDLTAGYAKKADVANNVVNNNLLLNGDFKVNQRGLSTYSGNNIYSVDRWKISGNGQVELLSNGIKFTANGTWTGVRQYFEKPSQLSNKTITVSFEGKCSAGIWASLMLNGSNIANVKHETNNTQTLSFTHTFGTLSDSDVLFVSLITQNVADWFELNWVKMEFGNVATKFEPRIYADELVMCQRYYEKIDTTIAGNIYNIYKFARNTYAFYDPMVKFIVEKRTRPTIKLYSINNQEGYLTDGNRNVDIAIKSAYSTTESFIIRNDDGEMVTGNPMFGYFEADAEIY